MACASNLYRRASVARIGLKIAASHAKADCAEVVVALFVDAPPVSALGFVSSVVILKRGKNT
jgi:hypothetical protein